MGKTGTLLLSMALGCVLNAQAVAASCDVQRPYEALIFDGATGVDDTDLPARLDEALTYKVEKMVFFENSKEDQTAIDDLAEIFPDLVVQAKDPWSAAAPVYALDGGQDDVASRLPDLKSVPVVLYGLAALASDDLKKWAADYPNLWFGISKPELDLLEETCLDHPIGAFLRDHDKRVVFASAGQLHDYKWTVRALRRVLSYMPPALAHQLAYENAERLYEMAVTAP